MTKFKAITLSNENNEVQVRLEAQNLENLSAGETLIDVCYSSINYKDALATQLKGGVVRSYPMIPGIDVIGRVKETTATDFYVDDLVVVTGFKVGVSHTGGFSEQVRVPNEWVVPLHTSLDLREAAIYGTAGLTAMTAITRLERLGLKDKTEASILVTGATGGVGSLAIIILNSLGYHQITAVSRKEDQVSYLKGLGASKVITPQEIELEKKKPLAGQRFDYVLDTIGGELLGDLLPQISYQGVVALCGNASGIQFSTTVLPFILRGITMTGIDTVALTMAERQMLWARLGVEVDAEKLAKLHLQEVTLETILPTIQQILEGTHTGRTIVRIK